MKTFHFPSLSPLVAATLVTGALVLGGIASTSAATPKPTVVLVHGAFADSSSWNGVIAGLKAEGYPVIAVANPLRGVKTDSDYVADVVDHTQGPVILVGHSYGGSVISNAVHGNSRVKALVYVAAFAPEKGETAFELSGRYPGSTLGPALDKPVVSKEGVTDLYIQQDKFGAQFAADVAPRQAQLMAAGQRPITEAALKEPAGAPAWKTLPSYFIYGSADRNIPEAALKFMADRAGAKEIVDVKGASHVVMVSNPAPVVAIIDDAAKANAE